MKAVLPRNAFTRFLLISGCLYLFLYLFYQFVIRRYTWYDQRFIGSIINAADALLRTMGYSTYKVLTDRDIQVFGIDGSNGVWVGSNCNAITLFSLFAVFIIAYPGSQRHKWWFIPLGMLAIHLLNIVRVAALAIIARNTPLSLDFNHTYTFTFLVYGFIFMLWMIWVNRFAKIRHEK